jgi:hypothetical protein
MKVKGNELLSWHSLNCDEKNLMNFNCLKSFVNWTFYTFKAFYAKTYQNLKFLSDLTALQFNPDLK